MGIGVTALLLVTAVVWGYRMTPRSVPCTALRYTIDDKDLRLYLTEDELTTMRIIPKRSPQRSIRSGVCSPNAN